MRVAILGPARLCPTRCAATRALRWWGEEILLFDCGERTTVNLMRAGMAHGGHAPLLHSPALGPRSRLQLPAHDRLGLRPAKAAPSLGPSGTREMTEASLVAHRVDVEYVRVFVEQLPEHIVERPAEALRSSSTTSPRACSSTPVHSRSEPPRCSTCGSSDSRTRDVGSHPIRPPICAGTSRRCQGPAPARRARRCHGHGQPGP
jgi:hypothetical protein